MASVERHRATSVQHATDAGDGWPVFQQALAALDRGGRELALALMAEAETLFRAAGDHDGEWRALLVQAVLHRQVGQLGLALAHAHAAAHAAALIGDLAAVGLVRWQLAAVALDQEDYPVAAERLRQAQAALEADDLAPGGGALAAAAQLCAEIGRWRYVAADDGPAAQVLAVARRDLATHLRETARQLRERYAQRAPAERLDLLLAAPSPPVSVPAATPVPPSLIGRVARWWRVLVNATPDELVRTTPPGTAPAQSTRQPTTLALPPPAAAIVIPTASPVPPQPLADDLAASPVRLVPQHAPADELVPLRAAAPAARTGLVIYTLGDLRVFYNDVQIEAWESARARAIFRYLVAQRPAAAQKERLAALLWPDSEPELARRSLHQAIYCLRQTLRRYAGDASVIQFANDTYQLAPEIAIWVDADVFAGQIAAARAHWSAGDGERAVRAYATAADLYQGDFLANEGGEEWVDERRGAFQVMYTEALHRLAQHYYERDDHSAAVAFSQRALAHDGCDEDAHRLLMLCYAAQGLRHLAVRQYQICVAALRTQLGLEPSDEMKDLYRRLVA